MGVKGLTYYIEQTPRMLMPHELHDTYLVIDGCNLKYLLYRNARVNSCNGGDYHEFRYQIQKIFSVFQQCNITPILIFDGGNPPDGTKRDTCLKRAEERNKMVVRSAITSRIRELLPILAEQVFYKTLDEMGIIFAQCDFEADNEIVVIAKYLEAPILSQDGDFYIFDNPYGFVPYNTVTFKTNRCEKNPDQKCVKCKIFNVENYNYHFPKLRSEVLPIFSALLGNDYVVTGYFKEVHEQLLTGSERRTDLIGKKKVLHWLQNKDTEEAIQAINAFMPRSRHIAPTETLREIISTYQDKPSSCIEYVKERIDESANLTSQNQGCRNLPNWFMMLIRRGILSAFVLNCVFLRHNILETQMERIDCDSVHACSLAIRRHIYGILKQISDFDGTVEEYLRSGVEFLPKIVHYDPKYISYFWKEYRIHGLLNGGLKIYFEMMGVSENFGKNLPLDLAAVLAVLVYWMKNAEPSIAHLNSITLSVINFGLIQPIRKREKPFLQPGRTKEYAKLIKAVGKNHVVWANQRLNQHGYLTEHGIVHSYCELQSCLYFANCLHSLLLPKDKNNSEFTLFNGSFIHRMNFAIESNMRNLETYLREDLGHEIYAVFRFIRSAILKEM